MTQKEKYLILRDISARLPYGLWVYSKSEFIPRQCVQINTEYQPTLTIKLDKVDGKYIYETGKIEEYKPYLRPMSSMTDEEIGELQKLNSGLVWRKDMLRDVILSVWYLPDAIDWLIENHFDYNDLIEKGLALEAPEGMYDKANGPISWKYYPKEFSSYKEYASYLKDNGLAYVVPEDPDSIITIEGADYKMIPCESKDNTCMSCDYFWVHKCCKLDIC